MASTALLEASTSWSSIDQATSAEIAPMLIANVCVSSTAFGSAHMHTSTGRKWSNWLQLT